MYYQTDDVNIDKIKELLPPVALLERFPLSQSASKTVFDARQATHNILTGKDDRLLVVIGPCSIHDTEAAIDYADRLKTLSQKYKNELYIVMRVYFEKPRTTVGWKGLISDPDLDKSFNVAKGLRLARNLLMDINKLGLPAGTEFLDMVTGQYISDLISWGAIGARTTESQVHRELASALSCPVGFKNGTDGNVKIAMDAIKASSVPHVLYSPNKTGQMCIYRTHGNPYAHVILRGGKAPNYHQADIDDAHSKLNAAGLNDKLMVDCSHGNSSKDHKKQATVAQAIANQITQGATNIFGVMIESFIEEGNQAVVNDQALKYGQSITDACVDMEETDRILSTLASAIK